VEAGTALMVGDSMSDILAAQGAGVRMAAVLWDTYDRTRVTAANPDTLFESVGEMDAWFRTLLN
jgi:phosphoglycolate phosphatase-like HAD superfamily hydrolase